MKLLSVFAILSIASVGMAAQVDWTAGFFDNAFTGGNAYLVQVSGDNASNLTSEMIHSYVQNNGLSYTGDAYTFSQLDSEVLQGSPSGALTQGNSISLEAGNYNIFVFVLSSDGTQFSVTSINGITLVDDPSGIPSVGVPLNFLSTNETFLNGTVGGGGDDPTVPEPTALALLALGVAGVALRRRVA